MTSSGDLSVQDILRFVRRRGSILLRALLIGLGLGVIASLALPSTYRAATLVTEDEVPLGIGLDLTGASRAPTSGTVTSGGTTSAVLATLAEVVKSDGVRERAIARLGPTMGHNAARAVLKTMRVKPVGESQLLRITVDSRDPSVAAVAANAVASTVINLDLSERRLRASRTREAVEQQLALAAPQLRASEDTLAVYQAQHKDVVLAGQTSSNLAKLAQLQAEMADVQLQRQEAAARIDAARTRLTSQARVQPVLWTPSPLITTLQNELATEEIEASGLRHQFASKYPPLIAVEAKIEETKRRLDAELARSMQVNQYGVDPVYQQIVQQLRQDEIVMAAHEARARALGSVVKSYETAFQTLPAQEVEQARLVRASKQAEAIYQALADRLLQARAAEASIGSVIRVVDVARAPERALRPRWLVALLGAVLGSFIGVGGVLMKERLVNPLASLEEAERELGMPVLGSIPPVPSDESAKNAPAEDPRRAWWEAWRPASRRLGSLFAPKEDGPQGAFAGSFRYLRTNLLYLQQSSLRTLLITSPGPDDEGPIVAANLAVALARVGLRVWLLDCDLRRSPLGRGWAGDESPAGPAPGLANLLADGTTAERLLRPTRLANLSVLPAGQPSKNPSDLLAGAAMRDFLERCCGDADVMILNAPPVLVESDASALAPLVDGVLLVVRLAATPRDAAAKARHLLTAVGAHVLGAVLTGASAEDLPRYWRGTTEDPATDWYLGPDARG